MPKQMQWNSQEYLVCPHYMPAILHGDFSDLPEWDLVAFRAWRSNAHQDAIGAGREIGFWGQAESGRKKEWGKCAISGMYSILCRARLMTYSKRER